MSQPEQQRPGITSGLSWLVAAELAISGFGLYFILLVLPGRELPFAMSSDAGLLGARLAGVVMVGLALALCGVSRRRQSIVGGIVLATTILLWGGVVGGLPFGAVTPLPHNGRYVIKNTGHFPLAGVQVVCEVPVFGPPSRHLEDKFTNAMLSGQRVDADFNTFYDIGTLWPGQVKTLPISDSIGGCSITVTFVSIPWGRGDAHVRYDGDGPCTQKLWENSVSSS